MGQGTIAQPQKVQSPITGIMEALQAVHAYYGINTEKAQQKLLESKAAQDELALKSAQSANETDSPVSLLAQDIESRKHLLYQQNGIPGYGAGTPMEAMIKGTPDQNIPAGNYPQRPVPVSEDDTVIKGKPGASANQIATIQSMEKPFDTYIDEGQKAKAMAMQAGIRAAPQENRNVLQAAGDYDKAMAPYRLVNEDIKRISDTLNMKDKNGNPAVTPQAFKDANFALSRIFSPNHQTESGMSQTDFETLGSKAAAALQKLSANPKDVGSRNVLNSMLDLGHHIANTTNENAINQLNQLDSGLQYLTGNAQSAAASKSKSNRQYFSKRYPMASDAAPSSGKSGGGDLYEQYLKTHGG